VPIAYCQCETPIMDPEYDAGCRRCGRPVDFTPRLDPGEEEAVAVMREQIARMSAAHGVYGIAIYESAAACLPIEYRYTVAQAPDPAELRYGAFVDMSDPGTVLVDSDGIRWTDFVILDAPDA